MVYIPLHLRTTQNKSPELCLQRRSSLNLHSAEPELITGAEGVFITMALLSDSKLPNSKNKMRVIDLEYQQT